MTAVMEAATRAVWCGKSRLRTMLARQWLKTETKTWEAGDSPKDRRLTGTKWDKNFIRLYFAFVTRFILQSRRKLCLFCSKISFLNNACWCHFVHQRVRCLTDLQLNCVKLGPPPSPPLSFLLHFFTHIFFFRMLHRCYGEGRYLK